VVSFKDVWQELRQQRQSQIAERQQQVQNTLSSFQQTRVTKAAQIRESLKLFQIELQQEVQDFLATANVNRQLQSQHLAQQLHQFAQSLREQTAQFLATCTEDRSLIAQQLSQDLGEFYVNLSTSVASLRWSFQAEMQQLQNEVKVLQADAHQLLQGYHQERISNQIQMMENLDNYVEMLRSEVQIYLSEIDLMRQAQGQQVRQALQQNRVCRLAEVRALFQQLSEFRSELRSYCSDIRQSVWGEQTTAQLIQSQAAFSQKNVKSPKVFSQNQVAVESTLSQKIQPVLIETTVPTIAQSRFSTPASKPVVKSEESLEQKVYNHLRQTQGARLTEIQSALGINRSQVVESLRNLIRQGIVTQRDRTYLIREEMKL
jgi:uncharacterized membrane protein